MKYLVETPGDFGLMDPTNLQVVAAFRPSVVTSTGFIEAQFGKKLTKLDVLTDEADDGPLALAKTEAELEAAIEALPRPEKKAPAKPAPAPAKK